MFKVNIITVGKVKESYYEAAVNEYKKRLSRFCDLTLTECKEQSLEGVSPDVALERESEEILKKLKGYVVVLAIEGQFLSSENFAENLQKIKDAKGEVSFVIGSSCGLSDKIKNRADLKISFSKMTFPHTLFRVMLFEQLYRAFMISSNAKYHK